MAILTAIAVARALVRVMETGAFISTFKPIMPVTANADSQVIATMPYGGRLFSAHLRVPATLGAGAVVRLQKRDGVSGVAVDITAPTTAATAGVVTGSTLLPLDFNAGDTIEVLVSGANVATAAGIEVDLVSQRA